MEETIPTRPARRRARPGPARGTADGHARPKSAYQRHFGAESKTVRSPDGVEIFYETVGTGDRVVVLANGLGGRLYSWEPVLQAFEGRFRFITWDYRGLFDSGAPDRNRRLSIPDHAEDIRAILDAEKVDSATFIGWSMGVQVSLEMATLYPDRVKRLVLINGTHGHALETGFQPFFRVPYVNRMLHELIDYFRARPHQVRRLARLALNPFVQDTTARLIGRLYSKPHMERFIKQYSQDIFAGDKFSNFLRLFQELDAHSVYHHLRDLPHPALVVYGDLDFLTPGYQSREIIRKMPNAEGLRIPQATHFVLLEYPDRLIPRLRAFLERA